MVTNIDRKHRLARIWSNEQLARIAPVFTGHVVNVSAWDDRDKQDRHYKDYFVNAGSYSYTNYKGYRGFQGTENEYLMDLTEDMPAELVHKFDVAYNHTTLEHIFDVRKAFANICKLSRDAVIIVVPFAQVQHEAEDYEDYWRFTPSCLRRLFEENGLGVIFESISPYRDSAVYLLFVGSRNPGYWAGVLPFYKRLSNIGEWIGEALPQNAHGIVE